MNCGKRSLTLDPHRAGHIEGLPRKNHARRCRDRIVPVGRAGAGRPGREAAAVLELEESLRDPRVRACGLVDDVGGKPAFHYPVRLDDAWRPSLAPAPRLGQPQS
ncbi:hypothetical protein RM530_08870 [Algiphilus sp. W345]|uniref:Uncharacterized protein n=1 Tax=Banduia mediterranea TaxID=3075609 RepID=A0ABU2WHX6_9GAMM|nr:hypothetical protein [Algiphilus sp. W345]MDT0497475.1 hypothetical protein [Algiphilus sp. W345]